MIVFSLGNGRGFLSLPTTCRCRTRLRRCTTTNPPSRRPIIIDNIHRPLWMELIPMCFDQAISKSRISICHGDQSDCSRLFEGCQYYPQSPPPRSRRLGVLLILVLTPENLGEARQFGSDSPRCIGMRLHHDHRWLSCHNGFDQNTFCKSGHCTSSLATA